MKTKVTATIPRHATHPRTLIGDYHVFSKELSELTSKLFPRKWIKPDLLICLIEQNEGGYTNIEKRAAREAAFATGAKTILVAEREIDIFTAEKAFRGESIEIPQTFKA